MRALRLVAPLLITISLTAGVLLAAPVSADSTTVTPALTPTVQVSVMTQNIFYGGDDYDLSTGDFCPVANGCPRALHRLAHIIEVSGADVVGVQEAEDNTRRLAHLLGWHASPQAHVISRFPILDPPHSHGIFTYVEPVPGRVIAVANTHLPSTPYGPYRVRAGWSKHRVLHLERTLRLRALAPVLKRLPRLAARGIPVFLTGDFNSPSYLDWTKAVAQARPKVRYAVRWPASKALADAGFHDSYRDAHPDPLADPGFTWSPGGPETQKHDFFDRIDWVLHAGPATTVSSLLVGERGNPQVDLAFKNPYPTDHRGVVSTFDVTAAPAPVLVAPNHRRVITGPPSLRVRFHANGTAGEVVGLRRAGKPRQLLRQANARGRRDGLVRIRTAHLRPGRYDVVLRDSATGRTETTAPIWVYRPGSRPQVTTDRRTYRVGSPIRVSWTRAPGNNLDWVSFFRCRLRCDGPGGYLAYRYTDTAVVGSVTFGRDNYLNYGSVRSLAPGQYVARLLTDDGYHAIGVSSRFRIVRR
ncbi:endonuclease/exonuclease/phosphatase family protein [Nocardioides sp.]|uniref:endonuclease/exonuclease/phosphatase family protein n=1 Tax=Nocardioides sp. TaxID=35761 RepID=UPI002F3EFCCE